MIRDNYINGEKKECCGCGACEKICPKKCIKMRNDDNGYVFPQVDVSTCVDCHLCEKVCPFKNKPEVKMTIEPSIIAARRKDIKKLLNASSGGAFGAIIEAISEKDKYHIFGAISDNHFQIRHSERLSSEDWSCFHKSKYVQSDLGDTYENIKTLLCNDEKVVFSGTPCQNAALINFLKVSNIKRDNLLCIDVVCHGVPSQKLFDQYINEEEKKLKSKITFIDYRHKRKKVSGKWDSRNLYFVLNNGKTVNRNRYQSRFLRGYHASLFYRSSCYACVFAESKRCSDITIADFWGINIFRKDLNVDQGISLIQGNTEAGMSIISKLGSRMDIYPVDKSAYMKVTKGALVQPSRLNPNRKSFLRDVNSIGFCKAVDKYLPKWKEIAKIEIYMRMNQKLRGRLKKMLHR